MLPDFSHITSIPLSEAFFALSIVMFGGVTVTGTLFLLFPTLTTILHAPGLLAVTFPFLVTVAIFLLLDVNFAPFCFTLIVVFLPTVKAIFFPDLIVTLALASTGFTAIIVAVMAIAITIEVICLKIFIFFALSLILILLWERPHP